MPSSPRPKVLIVEDDAEMRGVYRRLFDRPAAEAFDAEIVPDGESALAALRAAPVDLLVLDWGLPGVSGLDLVRALRSNPRTRAMGVIVVTGHGAAADVVAILDAGADDHLPKPFEEKEFLARLRSLTRRRDLAFSSEQPRRVPGLELDIDAGRLRLDGCEIALRQKELELLTVFLRRPDVLHSRRYLWDAAWGYESDGYEHALEATVSSLRHKLGPRWGARLRTHRGQGYSFDTTDL